MNGKKGFTLVELLVVIAIIALLMSILMPALARVRKQAQGVLCLSNLKQLGTCFDMYTSDNNGYFQQGWEGLKNCGCQGRPCSNWWIYAIKPYFVDPDICLCPVAAKLGYDVDPGFYGELGSTFYAWSSQGWLGAPGEANGSYAVNGWVENSQCEGASEITKRRRWRHTAVRGQGNIPLLVDAAWIDSMPQSNEQPTDYWDVDPRHTSSSMSRVTKNRHDGKVQGLFLDYSVRQIGLKELYTLKWHQEFKTDGPYTKAGGMTTGAWPLWLRPLKEY
ncbi:MAG: type II secretion system protein [Planctomycetota bacterium]|jgi:prepilin-type N-terminal cleavage/methylation domain-containing protein